MERQITMLAFARKWLDRTNTTCLFCMMPSSIGMHAKLFGRE